MVYIALSVICSTIILIIFRLMDRLGADTRHAITLSYLVASITGITLFSPGLKTFTLPWFWPAAVEGLVFYLVFRLIARTTQVNGIAVASIATKMSVIIPICIGILFLGESASGIKLLGVFAGVCAVALSAGNNLEISDWKWPVLVFLGTGFIDASFKLFQVWNLPEQQFPGFITTVFAFAFVVGLLHHLTHEDRRINSNSALSGTALGVTNFGTVYFMLKALAQPQWESSLIFPINNFGVVALSTIVAVLVFRERLTVRGWIGLGLAMASIGLLFLGVIDT